MQYQKVTHCERCGKKFWKGYFISVPSTISDFNVTKVVCWRCRFLKPFRELLQPASRQPKS